MRLIDRVPVAFDGARTGSAPLIWGQLAIWDVIRWLPRGDYSLNMSGWECPDTPVRIDDTVDALRALVLRHDSLRSRYAQTPDGPVQYVAAGGEFDLELWEIADLDVGACASEVGAALRRVPFDDADGLPFRCAALLRDGLVCAVVLVMSHMAVDAWSFAIVRGDIRLLLNASELPEAGAQPLDRVDYERSESGIHQDRKTRTYWNRALRSLPRPMLGHDEPEPDESRRDWARMDSRAAAASAHIIHGRTGTGVSSVVLSAAAVTLCAHLGVDRAGFRTIVATRFRAEHRGLVAAFNQNALVTLDTAADTFDTVVERASKAMLIAYRNCEGDPQEVDRIASAVAREAAVAEERYCFFNDVRLPRLRGGNDMPDRLNALDEQPAEPGAVAALLDQTVWSNVDSSRTQKSANFFLWLWRLDDVASVALCTASHFLAPGTARGFLGDMELLLAGAADPRHHLPGLVAGLAGRPLRAGSTL